MSTLLKRNGSEIENSDEETEFSVQNEDVLEILERELLSLIKEGTYALEEDEGNWIYSFNSSSLQEGFIENYKSQLGNFLNSKELVVEDVQVNDSVENFQVKISIDKGSKLIKSVSFSYDGEIKYSFNSEELSGEYVVKSFNEERVFDEINFVSGVYLSGSVIVEMFL